MQEGESGKEWLLQNLDVHKGTVHWALLLFVENARGGENFHLCADYSLRQCHYHFAIFREAETINCDNNKPHNLEIK